MEKVLIARAPVRVSFGGGGTDLPGYYERHGGMVVSATIGYYVYTILSPGSLDDIHVIYADHQPALQSQPCGGLIWNHDLGLPQAIAHHFNIRRGVTVFLASQVAPGTGLGLSGSVAVSMIKALAFGAGLDLGPREVSELACYIEIDKMQMPVGKQDQYAAAFGGMNCITFSRSGVVVEPLRLSQETIHALEDNIMLFFTGASNESSAILCQQRDASRNGGQEIIRRLDAIKDFAVSMRVALESGDLGGFGELLHHSWLQKRGLVKGITNSFLDQCYEVARQRGALGGKVTGAGGGGCLMLYCPSEAQQAVTEALTQLGAVRWPLSFEDEGTQIMQVVPWSRQQSLATMPWTAPAAVSQISLSSSGPM
jgi:D-glycero-alpha-D-manno-heptose-7-phosphate kinase